MGVSEVGASGVGVQVGEFARLDAAAVQQVIEVAADADRKLQGGQPSRPDQPVDGVRVQLSSRQPPPRRSIRRVPPPRPAEYWSGGLDEERRMSSCSSATGAQGRAQADDRAGAFPASAGANAPTTPAHGVQYERGDDPAPDGGPPAAAAGNAIGSAARAGDGGLQRHRSPLRRKAAANSWAA